MKVPYQHLSDVTDEKTIMMGRWYRTQDIGVSYQPLTKLEVYAKKKIQFILVLTSMTMRRHYGNEANRNRKEYVHFSHFVHVSPSFPVRFKCFPFAYHLSVIIFYPKELPIAKLIPEKSRKCLPVKSKLHCVEYPN